MNQDIVENRSACRSTQHHFLITVTILALVTGLGPASVDAYLPAIPAIADDLNRPIASIQISISLFLIGFAFGQYLFGPLSDTYGRATALFTGLALYIFASLACTQSTTAEELFIARTIQGIGSAACPVVSRAILGDRFTAQKGAQALAIMSMALATAPLIAPTVGGLLLTWGSWQTIFYALAIYACACSLALLYYFSRYPGAPTKENVSLFRSYTRGLSLLRKPSVAKHLLLSGCGTSPMFAYIAAAPVIYMQLFEIEPQQLGFFLGINIIATISGSAINAILLNRFSYLTLLAIGTTNMFLASLCLFMIELIVPHSLIGLMATVFIAYASVGVVTANSMTSLLAHVDGPHGTLSSLFGVSQYLFAGLAALLISYLGSTIFNLSIVMLLFALPAAAISFSFIKYNSLR